MDVQAICIVYLIVAEEAIGRDPIPHDIEVGIGGGLPLDMGMSVVGGVAGDGEVGDLFWRVAEGRTEDAQVG